MELLLGSHVREHGHRIGRLAGFEVEPDGLRVRRLIISPDGELGSHALTRSLSAVSGVRDGHEIELQSPAGVTSSSAAGKVMLISKATRLSRAGHALGRCVGAAVDPSDHRVLSVFGRHHWWSRRFRLEGPALDCSTPGEIRVGAPLAA